MSTAAALICPLCSSAAISATERDSLRKRRVRLMARCGQCGTWRVLVVTRSAARAIERSRRRDRRRMKRSLRDAERLGVEIDTKTLVAPAATRPAR